MRFQFETHSEFETLKRAPPFRPNSITLSESGEIQKQLSKELLRYEQDVERLCLSPLNDIMENDIPTVLKSRKLLNKASAEVDSLKLKLNQAIKHNQQSSGNNAAQQKTKVDSLTKELQDASLRLVQVKVSVPPTVRAEESLRHA